MTCISVSNDMSRYFRDTKNRNTKIQDTAVTTLCMCSTSAHHPPLSGAGPHKRVRLDPPLYNRKGSDPSSCWRVSPRCVCALAHGRYRDLMVCMVFTGKQVRSLIQPSSTASCPPSTPLSFLSADPPPPSRAPALRPRSLARSHPVSESRGPS
jgi:hypothetical protein